MKKVAWGAMKGLLASLVLMLAVAVQPAAAQDTDDCRCVDRDGNEIENCSCFRSPNFRGLVTSFGDGGFFTSARPRLGVSVDVGQSARHDARGARVTDLLEDGPAAEAGLEEGDVITSVNGQSLLSPLAGDAEDDFDLDVSMPVQRLLAISRELEPGEAVEVTFLRDGDEHTVTVEAADLESWGNVVSFRSGDGDDYSVIVDRLRDMGNQWRGEYHFDDDRLRERMDLLQERLAENRGRTLRFDADAPRLRVFGGDPPDVMISGMGDGANSFFYGMGVGGVELMSMKPALAQSFGVEEGVLVTDVDEESMLGLEAGDVILRIGDRDATTPNRVRRILGSYQDDEEITLHIMRQGRAMSVSGRLGN